MDFHVCDNKTYLFRFHLTGDTRRRHLTPLAMQPGPQPRSTVATCAVPYNQAAVHLHGSTGSAAPYSAHIATLQTTRTRN